ncbi:universal stress protein [Ruania halotolerans]|uniref:universal stress protein n=1 Tax=Ruania halotolerans TaxID=2897773 RepID=UPI001E3F053D|nr:universal stress protein [Ruania halotolerans]UFU08188.1 universal stress protein [Ruania halotolerans]
MSTEGAAPTSASGDSSRADARGRIVVGIDGSPISHQALRWGARLAGDLSLDLEAVAVWSFPPVAYGGYYVDLDWQPEEEAARMLDTAVAAVFPAGRPSWCQLSTREGRAAEQLVEASDNAEMLIVGRRGYGGFTALLLGSVSSACVSHAHCPVLVVPVQSP